MSRRRDRVWQIKYDSDARSLLSDFVAWMIVGKLQPILAALPSGLHGWCSVTRDSETRIARVW